MTMLSKMLSANRRGMKNAGMRAFAVRSQQQRAFSAVTLGKDSNQALGLGQYAIDFLNGKYGDKVDDSVYKRVEMFHTDSVMCGLSALALKTNAPNILRNEALTYSTGSGPGAQVFGSLAKCAPEKAIVANANAVREWDSNGTVFGYNPNIPGHTAGEFGHNDFYPVVVAAADILSAEGKPISGEKALKAMICLDEIRGRLAETFSLKSYKIDHVVHGAIGSAAVYGALMGATAEQIESAIGMTVAHYIPFRAIRAGKQLSDSKGASAAISTEVAIMSMKRSMMGFMGPRDIFRNPEAIFRFFEPTTGGTASDKNIIDIELANKARWGVGDAPFNLVLSHSGSDFAVCGMHFKLGLYEHQSAGAIEGVINLLRDDKHGAGDLKSMDDIAKIEITAYEPAFGIIGDPAKKDPKTRQSADHSMAFIVSRIMQKALTTGVTLSDNDTAWKELMLSPFDYGYDALYDPATRKLMQKIEFSHGGKSYDDDYPAGIPTSLKMTLNSGKVLDSGYMMFPTGHANNKTADLDGILDYKAKKMLGPLVFKNDAFGGAYIDKLIGMRGMGDAAGVYGFDSGAEMRDDHKPIDGEDGAPYLKLM